MISILGLDYSIVCNLQKEIGTATMRSCAECYFFQVCKSVFAGVRDKARALALAAAEAVEEGGSSWVDLETMVKELEAVAAA